MSKRVVLSFFIFPMMAFASGTKNKVYEAHFLDKMIEHHKEGVELANLAKNKSENKRVKLMSDQMVTEQKNEINKMKTWRSELYPDVPKAKDMPPKMDASELNAVSGRNFDRMYLEKMSSHHEMAVNMFHEASKKADNSKIKKFSKKGASHQEEEIKEMMEVRNQI